MKRLALACVLFALGGSAAWAGVVIEMEVTGPGAAGKPVTDTIYVEGTTIRMDPHASRGDGNMSMLFRDDTMWIIDHDEKQCQTIDKDGLESLSAQLGGAMAEMEAQMAQLPPEQREMMKKMMKGRMPGMGEEALPRRIENGAAEQVGEFACTVHTLYSGDAKVWEVCAADDNAVSEFSEAKGAFDAMSAFAEQLRESLKQLPFADMMNTPFYDMNAVGGVPVRVRTFAGGTMQSESVLKAVTHRDFDEAFFSVPKGYKVKSLADEIKIAK